LALHLLSSVFGLYSFEQLIPGIQFQKVIRIKFWILLEFQKFMGLKQLELAKRGFFL